MWILLKAYWIQFRLYVALVAFVAWTWAVYSVSTDLERASWERKESARKDVVIVEQVKSTQVSVAAGKRYEPQRARIQKTLATPDRTLDEIIQGPAGDVVLPGELGVRLNELSGAAEASPSASEPDSGMRGFDPIPDSERSAAGLEAYLRSQHGVGR